MALPDEVIEFGTLRKGFKEYSHPGLLDFNQVKLEGLRDLAKETQKGSPQALTSIRSKCYFPEAIETPLSKTWKFSKRNMNF